MIRQKDLPINVKESLNKLKNENEKIDIFPAKIMYGGCWYYYILFPESDDHVIIREDGVVPPLSEIEEVLIMGNATDTFAEKILVTGGKWVRRQTNQTYKRLLKLLERIWAKYVNDMSEEIKQDYMAYISTPKKILDRQKEIETIVLEKTPNLINRIKNEGILTHEMYQELFKYHNDMVKAGYLKNQILLETQEQRKRVLEYLKRLIPIWQLRMRMYYWELKHYEKYMRFSKEDQQMMEELKVVLNDRDIKDFPGYQNRIDHCRNPR